MAEKLLGLGWKGWVAIAVIVGYVFNVGGFQTMVTSQLGNFNQGGVTTVTTSGPTLPSPPPGSRSLQVLNQPYDEISGAQLVASTTSYDIIPYGNLGSNNENTAMNTATVGLSTKFYPSGTDWYIHYYSTLTNKYYDRWIHAHLPDSSGNGGQAYLLDANAPTACNSAPSISETAFGSISIAGAQGTTNYFQMPAVALKYEETQANTKFNMVDPTGTAIQSTTGTGQNGAGGENAAGTVTFFKNTGASNFTAAGKQFTANVLVSLADTKVAFGSRMITVSSSPPYSLQVRLLTAWFAVNTTALNNGYTTQFGWCLSPAVTPGFTTFYKFVDPVLSTQSQAAFISIGIPLDTTPIASSTKLGAGFYMADLQLPADVQTGTSDALPTAYGGVTAIGPSALIGRAYSINSSNQPATSLVHFRFTTA